MKIDKIKNSYTKRKFKYLLNKRNFLEIAHKLLNSRIIQIFIIKQNSYTNINFSNFYNKPIFSINFSSSILLKDINMIKYSYTSIRFVKFIRLTIGF